jgi:hypothetical protein
MVTGAEMFCPGAEATFWRTVEGAEMFCPGVKVTVWLIAGKFTPTAGDGGSVDTCNVTGLVEYPRNHTVASPPCGTDS